MSRSTIVLSLVCGALGFGCVERNVGDGPEGATTSGQGTTSGVGDTGAPTTGGSEPGSPTSGSPTSNPSVTGSSSSGEPDVSTGSSSEDTGQIFLINPDGGSDSCDVWAQDCPAGQKCAPWANDGGSSWNDTKCVPVTGDQMPGEACTAPDGGFDGKDDCIKGAMCWEVDAENVGTCIALCTGSPETPTCAEGSFCAVSGEGVLNICLPECDPLAQDCAGDDLCLAFHDTFICTFDASGEQGQVFDPCEFANACDPGLLCVQTSAASECDQAASGCCTPMCSLSAMAACPGVGQECTSFYEPGQAPPQHVDVGFCMIPR